METRQLVEASATVITIATVRAGDVYKRLDKPSYGSERLMFGFVTDVMNNGEAAAITAVEFTSEYGTTYEPAMKVFGPDTDLVLFPASIEEFGVAISEAYRRQEQAVESARTDLLHKETVLARMDQVIDAVKAPAPVVQIQG
jgi:hypothetical protein